MGNYKQKLGEGVSEIKERSSETVESGEQMTNEAEQISALGITAVWLPPAYKGVRGNEEVGYGVYDLYDLGEFYQKGTIPTKYGTKDEYLRAIEALKQNGIKVYADIVLNHRMGGDKIEEIMGNECKWEDHTIQGDLEKIQANTRFTLSPKGKK